MVVAGGSGTVMLLYRYHLTEQRNLFLGGDIAWLGYSERQVAEMGPGLIGKLLHDDDLLRCLEHHNLCRSLRLGQKQEIWYRMWSRSQRLLFCRSVDKCISIDSTGHCDIIEGQCYEMSREQYDGRKIVERAIARDAFTLHYQPIVDLATGEIVGHEALSRIEFDGAIVSPARFLPYLIGSDLEWSWVANQIELACSHLPRLDGFVSLNLSANMLNRKDLQTIFSCDGVGRLWFEVVEDAIGEAQQIKNLHLIRRLGHNLEADDVPTRSSLALILKAAKLFSAMKLDIEVCHLVADDALRAGIARSIISAARERGLMVICEGVQRPQDAELLLHMGATHGQGYRWGKPAALL
ncbi:MAG: EAL domain-containing protein [Cyanobacteria bacterium J06638_20]